MKDEISLVPSNSLQGIRVALSVSESIDLDRLGLAKTHLDLVVAEVTRAVIFAGGIVVYGGSLRPPRFTQIIMDEIRRYSDGRKALEIYAPLPEHREISHEDLVKIDDRLGMSGVLKLVSGTGEAKLVHEYDNQVFDESVSDAEALTSMRQLVSEMAEARIVLGGKLAGYAGAEPGVIEEARLTLENSRLLYVAGGYGGAASAIARVLAHESFNWIPSDFPKGVGSPAVGSALSRVKRAYDSASRDDGLNVDERRLLAVSHRPANIATLLVLGLSRAVNDASNQSI